ncbi:hypothetical protein [Legionella maioricensis]|uniref:Coiled-coil protein n=1 Tax=Legionella maioricensis TaxID=2896528 RepID=A0A9X2CZ42_9GAMM|nr:hypothetical protein [Legionella maioricensis]MCL9683115.1 hypothetical protein [Legionella maioricensis]MCL9688014.1 hypothetical protein [Legionella maioricensis]
MVYSSQNAAFRRDKHQFFSQFPSVGNLDTQINTIDKRVQNIGYTFLLQNQNALETEFTQMFAILQQQDDENKEIFWLYCYYCASLLEAFYTAYSQPGNANKYKKIKQQIKNHLNHDKENSEVEKSFIQSLQDSFLEGFRNLVSSPFHVSQIRDYVAYSNLCRIYWTFCRLTLTQGFSVARDLKLIDKLDALLGTHTDVDKIIGTLQAPTFIINYFSVGFFLMRFMIDGGMLLKHTFCPTELEEGANNSCEVNQLDDLPGAASIEAYRNSYIMVPDEDGTGVELYYIPKSGKAERLTLKDKNKLKGDLLAKLNENPSIRLSAEEVRKIITAQTDHVPEATTRLDRFKHELYKRHCNFANDLVWATVNFLTNFNQLVHISGPVAGYLTSAFLVFDVGMALYKCNLAKQEYLTKKAQYIEERDEYNNPERFKKMSDEQRRIHIEMLDQQLMALEINWRTKEATFYFVAAAAALLMLGFTASMLVSPAVMVVGCYFVCTIAVAMYLSAGAYSKYQEKSLYLEQAQLTGKNLPVAQKEFEAARNDFIFTMIKNTVMPLVLITTFAVCWPAAVVLTAMYVGYELYHAYDQHSESKAIKQLALAGPQEEREDAHLLPSPAF